VKFKFEGSWLPKTGPTNAGGGTDGPGKA
jgi:hypothetical protein